MLATESPPLAVPTAEAGRQWRQGRTRTDERFGGNNERTTEGRTETKELLFIGSLGFPNGGENVANVQC